MFGKVKHPRGMSELNPCLPSFRRPPASPVAVRLHVTVEDTEAKSEWSKIENPSTSVDGESRELQLLLFNFLCNLNRAAYKCPAKKWVALPAVRLFGRPWALDRWCSSGAPLVVWLKVVVVVLLCLCRGLSCLSFGVWGAQDSLSHPISIFCETRWVHPWPPCSVDSGTQSATSQGSAGCLLADRSTRSIDRCAPQPSAPPVAYQASCVSKRIASLLSCRCTTHLC